MNDHDQRFKEMLSRNLREFFDLFFPQWLGRIDWSKIEWLDKEAFIDPPQGERRILDLVARVAILESCAIESVAHYMLLIHVEIESGESVASFHARFFEYYAWLRMKHQIPVLPIGLFLRVGHDGVGWWTYSETLWDEVLVQFRYPYVGLPALPAPRYLNGENLLGVALSALMNVPVAERARLKAEAMQRLATAQTDTVNRFLLSECVQAYLPLEDPQMAEYEHLLLTRYGDARMLAKTSFDLGMEKGIEKGIDCGREREQMNILRRQLAKRFGALNPSVWNQLESMSFEQRDILAENIVTARSLEELGLKASSQTDGD